MLEGINDILVSIIIPVYNVETYLEECLESVIRQTLTNKEVILIDDGSTDSSGTICDNYSKKYSYIRTIHKVNGGLSSARNRGLEEANGEWIIFLDSDDYWGTTDCLSKLHNYATKYNVDILRFEYEEIQLNGKIIQRDREGKSFLLNRTLSNFELVRYGINVEWFAWLYFIKKKVLDGYRFKEDIKYLEDIEFYSRLFASKALVCAYIDEPLYFYRKRNDSLTTTPQISKLKASFNLCDFFWEYSFTTQDKQLKKFYRYQSTMRYYWALIILIENPSYYKNRNNIIQSFDLVRIQNRIATHIKDIEVKSRYYPFICTSPYLGIILLKVKNSIILNLQSTKSLFKKFITKKQKQTCNE